MVLLGPIFCTTRKTRGYYLSGVLVMCNKIQGEMLMTDYALNKRKRDLLLRSPDSPGQVRSVRKIRILREKVRSLRASAKQQKNR
jgi:hypothetical protein